MKKINIDGYKIKKYGHIYLKKILKFPDYYGENLDALYDCLTDIGTDTEIILSNDELVHNEIIDTFKDASNENSHISFKITD